MITQLRASNFRCFESLHLAGLEQINLIVGHNASGKTALLEALACATTAAAGYDADGSERMTLLARLRRHARPPGRSPGDRGGSPDRLPRDGGAKTDMKVEILGNHPDDHGGGPVHAVTDPDDQGRAITGARLWHIRATDAYRTIVASVRAVHPAVTDIGVERHDGGPAPHVMLEGDSAKRPLSLVSRGIERTLNTHVAIEASRSGIALIDDVESGLDRDAMTRSGHELIRAARRHNAQVFATTHSYDYLRKMRPTIADHGDRIRLIRTTVEQKRSGRIHRVSMWIGDTLEAALEAAVEVR